MARILQRAVTQDGVLDLDIDDPAEQSLAGSHLNAVQKYLGTGSVGSLAQFAGRTVVGHVLETDPDRIEDLEAEGQLDFDEIYSIR